MEEMFYHSNFNSDISKWDVSNAKNMSYMFAFSQFNGDISDWDVKKSCKVVNMFLDSIIEDEYKPKSLQD
jgi:surface protein